MSENTFLDRQGRQVWLRPLQDTDAPLLVNVFEHMSSDSRYRRFQTSVDNLSPSRIWTEAERIVRIPPEHQYGLIAFMDIPNEGEKVPVGIARYVVLEPDIVEAAISIRDDIQNSGIGSHLFLSLVEAAYRHGVVVMTASIQNSNTRMWRLVEKQPYAFKRSVTGDSSDIRIQLGEPKT